MKKSTVEHAKKNVVTLKHGEIVKLAFKYKMQDCSFLFRKKMETLNCRASRETTTIIRRFKNYRAANKPTERGKTPIWPEKKHYKEHL